MASSGTYPSDGSLPQHLSVDLSNINVTQAGLSNTPFFQTNGQAGYDVFDGNHGGNNIILSNPSGNPNYQGQYFYSGAYVGGKFLLQPTINGSAATPNLSALTPNHLDITLSPDKSTYSVTATYTPTAQIDLSPLLSGVSISGITTQDLTGMKYTIGPDANGNPQLTLLRGPNQNDWLSPWGGLFSSTVQQQLLSALQNNNLVPTTVSVLSQAQLPEYNNTNVTVVSANVPGHIDSTSASTLHVPGFTIPQSQNMANFLVSSQALPNSAYLNPFSLYDAIQNSNHISDTAKQWLLALDTVRYDTPVDATTRATQNQPGTSTRLYANILSYGVAATFSGNYLTPVRDRPITKDSNGNVVRWDAYNNIHGLWLHDQYGNPNPNLSQSDFDGIIQAIHDASNVGIPLYEYTCFLPGTLIQTPRGPAAIETLKRGDEILTLGPDGIGRTTQKITEINHQSATIYPDRPDDRAGWPVCIRQGAFEPGIPSKDLYVTAEHCFFFEKSFVPIRMLINGKSIHYDYSKKEYEYYHLATEHHSIIWANDALTESWLDTGNDAVCSDCTKPRTRKQWGKDSCYPLNVDRDFVEGLYRYFAARCGSLKIPFTKQQQLELTEDPGLYIETEGGNTLLPLRQIGNKVLFRLPPVVKSPLHLCSRTFRPCDVTGPFLDDRRTLGVLIGNIHLWLGHQELFLTTHLDLPSLQGWDVQEQGPHRWTQGRAVLALPNEVIHNPLHKGKLLVVEILAGGPYPPDPKHPLPASQERAGSFDLHQTI